MGFRKRWNLLSTEDCFETYERLRAGRRQWRTQVVWLWGSTGSGKSRRAWDEANNLCQGSVASVADSSLKWFEPYAGHKGAIFDDFDGSAPLPLLLRLFDRYPMDVAIKGEFVSWVPRIVWVTSNYHPRHFYARKRVCLESLVPRALEDRAVATTFLIVKKCWTLAMVW